MLYAVVLTETKTDQVDSDITTGLLVSFKCVFKTRYEYTNRSGGIAIFVFKKYENFCKIHLINCKCVQWLTIDTGIVGCDKDILIGSAHIPPENSRYVDIECFHELLGDLSSLSNNKLVLLLAIGTVILIVAMRMI